MKLYSLSGKYMFKVNNEYTIVNIRKVLIRNVATLQVDAIKIQNQSFNGVL